jgi:DNA repair exonuclease SbcCD nuclease subunit
VKRLVIGDPHIRPSNLDESERLMRFVNSLIRQHKPDRVEILGDLFHLHSIVRLEVLEFWNGWLDTLTVDEDVDIIVLVGNHDIDGDYSSHFSSLSVFQHMARKRKNLKIVEHPRTEGVFAYISYHHDPEQFLASARYMATQENAKVLVCHQTIVGAQFENGFYSPDGIDPKDIPFDLIFSGHIHMHQILKSGEKTVIYPGTPSWQSASDVNEDKGVWIYTHDDETGKLLNSEFFSTASVCKPMVGVTWTQGEEMPKLPEGEASLHVELVGSSDWVKEQKELFQGKAAIKARITDSRPIRMKSGTNFEHFFNNVFQTELNKEELLKFMKGEGLA